MYLPSKYLPAVQETWFQSLDWEDPLEEEMTTHSSILAWRIPWIKKLVSLQSMESQKSLTGLSNLNFLNIHTSISKFIQASCQKCIVQPLRSLTSCPLSMYLLIIFWFIIRFCLSILLFFLRKSPTC